jgi:hypothetical protein
MGFATTRAAITSYLQDQMTAGNLPSIASISSAPQPINVADIYYQASGTSSGDEVNIGAAVWLYLAEAHSLLYAPPANWGQQYTLDLIVLVNDPSGDGVNAQIIMDNALDELRSVIRANRNAGDPSVVFAWGVGDLLHAGSEDIRIMQHFPDTIGANTTAVNISAIIEVSVIALTTQAT